MAEGHGHPEARERPTADLMRDLSDHMTRLLRKEVELANVELDGERKRATDGAGMFGGAALFGLFAFGALSACLILALATFLDPWIAALIVTDVYAAIAGILALRGKSQLQKATPPVPQQAVDSTKEDLEWVKTRAKSGRS